MEKKQFMAMLDQLELDRVDALRIVMSVSRAEVVRQALAGGGLKALEDEKRERLRRLYALANDRGSGEWRMWVRETVENQKTLPSLEVMEIEARERTERNERDLEKRKSKVAA